jgi:hypothetical protein
MRAIIFTSVFFVLICFAVSKTCEEVHECQIKNSSRCQILADSCGLNPQCYNLTINPDSCERKCLYDSCYENQGWKGFVFIAKNRYPQECVEACIKNEKVDFWPYLQKCLNTGCLDSANFLN